MDKNTDEIIQQIRDLRHKLVCSQIFSGYSGWARIIGGAVALLGGLYISSGSYPQTNEAHIQAWLLIGLLSFLINIGGLLIWNFKSKGNLLNLLPTLDIVAPLFIASVLSLSLILNNQYNFLFGTWMCLFGLVHTSSRHSTTRGIFLLGWYYIICGTFLVLIHPLMSFLDPMPMAFVFFIGEIFGGYLFIKTRNQE